MKQLCALKYMKIPQEHINFATKFADSHKLKFDLNLVNASVFLDLCFAFLKKKLLDFEISSLFNHNAHIATLITFKLFCFHQYNSYFYNNNSCHFNN